MSGWYRIYSILIFTTSQLYDVHITTILKKINTKKVVLWSPHEEALAKKAPLTYTTPTNPASWLMIYPKVSHATE